MQPNYEEEARKRQQQSYQQQRDPFEYGQQVAQRRYSEIMSGIDAQRGATERSYGDLYQQARQRAVRGQAMGGPTLSGGMGQQQRDFVSALEMQELGRIGSAREQAIRQIDLQRQSAFSNAQLEGQQATQMQLQNQQTQFQLFQQREAILNDPNLTPEQKQTQLQILGQPMTSEELAAGQVDTTAGSAFGAAASIAIPVGIGTLARGRAVTAAIAAAKPAARKAAADAALKAYQAGASQKTVKDVASLAYKKSMKASKAPSLGISGRIYGKITGSAAGKLGAAKAIGGTALKFAGKAIGIYAVVSGVETLAELLGVAEGRGFSGLITKEGSNWDKLFETLGL